MDNIYFKNKFDNLEIEYDVVFPESNDIIRRKQDIADNIQSLDELLANNQAQIDKLNNRIEYLSNDADWIDNVVAISSGVLTGLLDVFLLGKLDLTECNNIGSDFVNELVKKLAGENGTDENALKRAIEKLEKLTKSKFPSDSNLNDFGGGAYHHLRDFAHHPTIVGLVFSLLTQFTGMCYGTDTAGRFLVVKVKDESRIGKTFPQKIVYGTLFWFLHLVSDMAGTHKNVGTGTGLPGPILSLAKELSVIPPFCNMKFGDMELTQLLSKIFSGTLFSERDENGKLIKESVKQLDLRTEIGMLKKQAMPVLINEVIVRTFYSIRRFVVEIKEKKPKSFLEVLKLDWRRIAPFGTRTVERMITISSGTFMTIDVAGAAIEGAMESGGTVPGFIAGFIVRVNFVGIGRFAIACVTDAGMGIKKKNLGNELMDAYAKQIQLLDAKVYYKQADMWIEAEETGIAIKEVYECFYKGISFYAESLSEIRGKLNSLSEYVPKIEDKNPGLTKDLNNILKWGI